MLSIATIIPAYNEEKTIAHTLNSLLYIFPHHDIYVISDGSSDSTVEKAREYTPNVLDEKINRGKMGSLKTLIDYYHLLDNYDYIFFMDADTSVSYDFIENVKPLLDSNTACIVGQIISRNHNFLTFYRKIEYFIGHEIYKKSQSSLGIITVAPGCSSIFSTSSLREMDFENPTLAEDLNLTIQIYRKKLGKIKYCNKALVYTQDPGNLKDFIHQTTRWNCGWFQCLKKYRVPFGFTKFDFEALYLTSEGIIYGFFTLLLPYLIYKFPYFTLIGLISDFIIFFLFTIYISFRNGNLKYIPFIPFYYILKTLQSVIYIKCLFFNKYNLWRKVGRY